MHIKPRTAAAMAATTLILTGCTVSGTITCASPNAKGVVVCKATPKPTGKATPKPTPTTSPTPTATATPTPAPTGTPTATATPTTTATPTPTPTGTTAPGLPAGATFKQIDGGPDYNARFSPGLPTDPGFFPIAVWFESVGSREDAAFDKATGLNTYVAITPDSRMDYVREAGMYAFPWADEPMNSKGSETVGYILEDEPDMMNAWWDAPRDEHWTHMDNILYNVLPKDNRAKFTNYGLGILSTFNDAEASEFVLKYSDYLSVDCYMYTGPFFEHSRCLGQGDDRLTEDEARRARNYGILVERMRKFGNYTKPAWGFVEVAGGADGYIKPEEVRAAMWHIIIAGGRGMTFFNHSFSGEAQTNHALREPFYAPTRAAVQSTTAQIRELAPIINAPDVVGLTTHTDGVTALTKWNDGKPVIFAGTNDNQPRNATFTVKGQTSGTVTVLGENRTIPLVNGSFTDNFASGTAVHIYRVG